MFVGWGVQFSPQLTAYCTHASKYDPVALERAQMELDILPRVYKQQGVTRAELGGDMPRAALFSDGALAGTSIYNNTIQFN